MISVVISAVVVVMRSPDAVVDDIADDMGIMQVGSDIGGGGMSLVVIRMVGLVGMVVGSATMESYWSEMN